MSEGAAPEAPEKAAHVAPADTLTPADRYQELFVAVQTARVFPDSKTFVDCAPLGEPEDILAAYRAQQDHEDFNLADFVKANFATEAIHESHYRSDPDQPIGAHIDALWDVLTRSPEGHPQRSSLLPLPTHYVVPGGRFGELYYWDSYFMMLGLVESGRPHLLRAVADNFAYLIDTYGHVPNGNRSYYLSRSQPPMFASMVELVEDKGIKPALHYLPQLRKEYAYWMNGVDDLRPGEARRYVVKLDDGSVLNRYWDDRDSPREESYLEDVTTAKRSSRPAHEVYRDLRAGAASGWDFSSRWLDDPRDLSSIRTTSLLPVDLNCFLCKLELQIARLTAALGEECAAARFRTLAAQRRAAIDATMWDDRTGAYYDYDWQRGRRREILTAATAAPLFVQIASDEQARRTAATMIDRLLAAGGFATTEAGYGEQWDWPNGWAPLQWMAIAGLRHYGGAVAADEIARRWLRTVSCVYEAESKLVEKYSLVHVDGTAKGGGGGEYPLQDGFGWTNGVTRKLLHESPDDEAHHSRAGRPRKRRRDMALSLQALGRR
jgi:alpha,alpha-trehalase